MKKFNAKDIFVPVFSLAIICIVVSLLLALTNAVTISPIEENEKKKADELRKSIFTNAQTFEEYDGYYSALDSDGNIIGYIFETSGKGYGGTVSVMTGITYPNADIAGIEILSHSETPGLGANCTNDSFKDSFKQSVADNTDISVVKDGTGGSDGKVDAITGATITSSAVTNAVNEAINKYNILILGGTQ